jgi:hypothetical protein
VYHSTASNAEVFIPGLPLLNVRLICDTQADDVNLIESSVVDEAKIAAAMARGVREQYTSLH